MSRAEDVKINLGEDLTRREHLAAINIQLQIEIAPEIGIWHLYGHDLVTDPAVRTAVIRDAAEARRRSAEEFGTQALPDLITNEKGIRIFAPDLAFGETYWIVFELEVPDGADLASLGRARVQYVDTVARDNRQHVLELTRQARFPRQPSWCTRSACGPARSPSTLSTISTNMIVPPPESGYPNTSRYCRL